MKAYSYIRFSTPEQLKGNSLERQTQAADKYCKENGLTLDTSINMQALGQSAHKGVHRTKGPLGVFLNLIQKGKIEKGSVLIVENLDRLTREEIIPAQQLFFSIIEAGIKLVTLTDRQEYTSESINNNPMQLIISIVTMMRGHDESRLKSIRIRATRDNNLKNEKIKILTGKAKKWLKPLRIKDVREHGKQFEVIPAAKVAIRQIFEWKLARDSGGRITDKLNKQAEKKGGWSPPKWKRNEDGRWHESYVQKILQDRAVLGEFQPHKSENGKKEKAGGVRTDYFPRIIDDETFYRVQRLIEKNKLKPGYGGGRTGKVKNLFTSIVRCGLCQGPMYYENKGEPPKGGKYLTCQNKGCLATGVRYDEFEGIVLNYLQELDFSQLIPQPGEREEKRNSLKVQIETMEQQVIELQRNRKNVTAAMFKSDDEAQRDRFIAEEKQLFENEKSIAALITEKKYELNELKVEEDSETSKRDQIVEVRKMLEMAKDDEDNMIRLRHKLRSYLQEMIALISVRPLKTSLEELPVGRRNRLPGHEFQKHGFDSTSIAHIGIRFKYKKLTKSLVNQQFILKEPI